MVRQLRFFFLLVQFSRSNYFGRMMDSVRIRKC